MSLRPVVLRCLVQCCLLLSIGHATPCESAPDEPQLLYLEPQRQRSFGPQKPVPKGTVFHLKVVRKADGDALRLHRCAVPCKSAVTVKVWAPDAYRGGDELTWRVEEEATYYLWAQDVRGDTAVPATAYEFVGKRLRIYFDSSAVIEAWYVSP